MDFGVAYDVTYTSASEQVLPNSRAGELRGSRPDDLRRSGGIRVITPLTREGWVTVRAAMGDTGSTIRLLALMIGWTLCSTLVLVAVLKFGLGT